ncbi:hypothetical protein V1477_003410 [Vespula maculifrons]|uniref:Uncharacterized protein n=1 Tax=Vespula maculifrons TaxID=7453 RepID=A0ABD2CUF7_VESMC
MLSDKPTSLKMILKKNKCVQSRSRFVTVSNYNNSTFIYNKLEILENITADKSIEIELKFRKPIKIHNISNIQKLYKY